MKLKVEQEDEVFFVIPSGELVAGDGDSQLRGEIDRLQSEGHSRVVVDLSQVPYFDSSVLGQLVHGHSVFKNAGGGLKLLNPTKRVMDLLSLTRLITVFDVCQSKDEALKNWT